MAAKIDTTEAGAVRMTIDSKDKPQINPKDWLLREVEFESVDNGFIVNRRYRMTPEAEAKARKTNSKGQDPYIDTYRSERSVCTDAKELKALMSKEVARMAGEQEADDDHEEPDGDEDEY